MTRRRRNNHATKDGPGSAAPGRPAALRSAQIIVLLLLGAFAVQAYFIRRAETEQSFDQLKQTVEALDFQLDATFRTIDELLAEFGERVDLDRWPDPVLSSWVTGRLAAMPSVNTVMVIGLDGRPIGPGVGAKESVPAPFDAGQREYFRYHLAFPSDRNLHVGAPFVSRLDQQFALPVSRGVFDKAGKLRAVVRITVDPDRLIGRFADLMSSGTMSIALFHDSSDFLTGTFPRDPGFAGFSAVTGVVRHAADGTGTMAFREGDGLRLAAYHGLPKYHLAVVAGMRGREAYAAWRREQLPAIVTFILLAIAIIALAALFDRRERLHEGQIARHQQELEGLVAERTAELKSENRIRAKTEEALRASRRRLVSITDSLVHGIIVFNAAGEVVFANLAARRFLGAEELEGLPLDDFLQVVKEGEPVPFSRSALAQAARDMAAFHDDDAAIRIVGSGADLPVAYVCVPLAEESNRRSLVLSFRDITDIKRAQWEVLQASRLASVGQLAAGIAHEINTPVQYIGNNLSFIADSVGKVLSQLQKASGEADAELAFLAEELPAAVAESLDGVAHIARIVLSMKEFSHPGGTAKVLVDLNRALDTTATVSSNVWKHVATIERDYDPNLPQVPCLAGEMNQVFLNLIVNAAHAIEGSGKPLPGKITLTTRLNGEHVEIRVEDSGTGVPQAIRDKIFDPFFTTKEVGKGTGQGLAICRDVIVVKHGGSIEIGGAEGAGAVFIIRLPLAEASTSL